MYESKKNCNFAAMKKIKNIALVAHDNRKKDLIEWVEFNAAILEQHNLVCTGTTGKLVKQALMNKNENDGNNLRLELLKSGPLGGDQQLGAKIAMGEIDVLIFFTDQMTVQPHDVDVKALTRLAVLYDIVMACNRSSADFIISSQLFTEDYKPIVKDYSDYLNRKI